MKRLCVIQLNTLRVSYTKLRWVGHLFTYVKTCERDRVNDFEQWSCVYKAVRYNAFCPRGPRRRYNEVAVYIHHYMYLGNRKILKGLMRLLIFKFWP